MPVRSIARQYENCKLAWFAASPHRRIAASPHRRIAASRLTRALVLLGACGLLPVAPTFAGPLPQPEVHGSLVLGAQSGNEWVYDVSVTGTNGYSFTIPADGTVVLSGLSSVTGAAVAGTFSSYFAVSYTVDTVTFTANTDHVLPVSDTPYGELDVYSSAPTSDIVNFALQGAHGTVEGTVGGPFDVPVPEPDIMTIMVFALLGLTASHRAAGRRRRERTTHHRA